MVSEPTPTVLSKCTFKLLHELNIFMRTIVYGLCKTLWKKKWKKIRGSCFANSFMLLCACENMRTNLEKIRLLICFLSPSTLEKILTLTMLVLILVSWGWYLFIAVSVRWPCSSSCFLFCEKLQSCADSLLMLIAGQNEQSRQPHEYRSL